MKTIGIVGGTGPESTIEYYRLILALYRQHVPDGGQPAIIIDSINNKKLLDSIAANALAATTEYLLGEVKALARAGAELGLLAANTPHIVFDEVQAGSPIPLVSIVEATCEAAKALGLKRLGLIGTRFTMQGRFYPKVFSREGITLVIPEPEEQEYIHGKYMGELVHGIVLPETHDRLVEIIGLMKEREGIEGLILGGTELSLILREPTAHGVLLLDTTRIHAQAAVAQAMS